jgi:HAD superfamily hydrolase (TIGR01549 family)
MKRIRHFIWDFDGTLVDTYPNITSYLQKALLDFGYEVDKTDILEKMLVTIPHSIKYYSELYGIEGLRERYDYYNADEKNAEAYAFENVLEVLRRIRELGAANYVFTNRGNSAHAMLEKAGLIGEFTEIVTSADPCFKTKPEPDTILYLMEKYGGTCEDTVMVGDRQLDLSSAYAAGCKTIHLVTPSVPQTLVCDWRIENYAQMLELLK